jgi:hypothetical protein
MYSEYCRTHEAPPKRIEDLEPYAARYPSAFEAIRSGDWIILWGKAPAGNPAANLGRVLAYEKDVLSGRGYVTYMNCTGGPESKTDFDEEMLKEQILEGIGRMYIAYWRMHGKPPTRQDELKPFSGDYPQSYEAIGKDRWIVYWGTRPSGDPREDRDIVLASERILRSNYNIGWVVTADGNAFLSTDWGRQIEKAKRRAEGNM